MSRALHKLTYSNQCNSTYIRMCVVYGFNHVALVSTSLIVHIGSVPIGISVNLYIH